MLLFTLIVLLQVIFKDGYIGYDLWSGIFANQPMKVLTFVVFLSMAWHVWLGMREIYIDYFHSVGCRLVVSFFTAVWLCGCLGWAVQVLWRV